MTLEVLSGHLVAKNLNNLTSKSVFSVYTGLFHTLHQGLDKIDKKLHCFR